MAKVKICGITNLDDARLAARLGSDAVGFNFYEKSVRYIAPLSAARMIAQLDQPIEKVGVFVNHTIEEIVEAAELASLDAVQLHGDESPQFICDLKAICSCRVIKALRVSPD